MHEQATNFTIFVKQIFPEYFANKHVLDVGSGDINGNNRFLFDSSCIYNGNDVFAAPNVTIVSKTSALQFEADTFDTVASTECFEHDPEFDASLQKIVTMLKPGCLFFFTCATTGRPEHGTRRTSPHDSYGTIGNVSGWTDHYKNITISDLNVAINIADTFAYYNAYNNSITKDLYFWGIKKGGEARTDFPEYKATGITRLL